MTSKLLPIRQDTRSGSRPGATCRVTDPFIMAALGLTSTDYPLFESIKADLRAIMQEDMDWHKAFDGQTKDTGDLVKAQIVEKYPAWGKDAQSLNALLAYCRRYYRNARWAFQQQLASGRSASPALHIPLGDDCGIASMGVLERTPAREADNIPSAQSKNQACSRNSIYNTALLLNLSSTESDTTAGPCGEEGASDYALLDLLRSRNKNAREFSALTGADTKIFTLALHIAQLYSSRRDSAGGKVAT